MRLLRTYWRTVVTRRDGLAQARDAIGHSQDSLAAELEVTGKTVSNWERGYSKPTRRNELQLARILKLTHQQVLALLDETTTNAASPAVVDHDAIISTRSRCSRPWTLHRPSFWPVQR
ncbi:helix-turn-helix domain-containing protein [Amycolatopsis sp. cmx-4-54]|uniref:helix-turn-helix domain-containing protein n=1 Tax=Amycolatopsis sp. cmx-4-54 TaxID=2790936 RepID=UPI00397A3222